MTGKTTTLQRTLSIHFVAVAIIPILFFGVVTSLLLYRHLQGEVYSNNQLLAEDIAVTTKQYLEEVERDLQVVATTITKRTVTGSSAIEKLLQVLIEESGYFESIYLLDTNHHVDCLGLDPRIARQREDYRNADYSQHPIFIDNHVLTGPTWSDTFVSLVTGEPSVTIALPLSDGRVLLGNVSLRRLSATLAHYSRGRADLHAIVDKNGTLVAHSDPLLPLQRVNMNDHATIARALRGHAETVLERHGSVDVLESTSIVERTGWVTWVGIDMQAVMAPVDHIRDLLAVVMLLAVLFAAIVAIIDARRLMKPLAALSQKAGQIGAGQYEFTSVPSGFTEIDQLTTNLTVMIQAVRDRERQLTASEQRYRDLVNSIEGVVWELDLATGQYVFVSQQVQAMFGFSAEHWERDPEFWNTRVHPDDVAQIAIRNRPDPVLTENQDLEYRVFDSQGHLRWVRDLINIIGENHKSQRLLGVMVDITARKLAETELARYRARLEELVTERTQQLAKAQAELVQKERLAVLGQLTATVSHEIRNPLGTVANSLFVMREMLPPDCLTPLERPLALAERNIQRCDGIISELLDFTRRREAQLEARQIDLWLEEVLQEMVWPSALECRWQLASGLTVWIDPERLRRALVNVIDNALQAMNEKGASGQQLAITCRHVADRCELIVQDNGPGIPAAIREHIFEPLFSTKTFGVGLGVPIIRNIMEDHGGGVEYASVEGEGTTVTLWLPLRQESSTSPG